MNPDQFLNTDELDDYLAHYGVLGMKWGVRKDGKPQGFQYGEAGSRSRKQKRRLKKDQKKWDKTTRKNWTKAYNAAADRMNTGLIEKHNKKYEGVDVSDISTGVGKKFMDEYNELFAQTYSEEFEKMFGKRPS